MPKARTVAAASLVGVYVIVCPSIWCPSVRRSARRWSDEIKGVRFRQSASMEGNGFFGRGFVSLLVMDETQPERNTAR
jgi:hypothetical protein